MRYAAILSLLLVSALLEASGDALIRSGIRASPTWTRAMMLGAGALVLFVYGCLVNAPSWDFGRTIGVYVVLFFLSAQAIAWIFFSQAPSRGIWLGGIFIVIGGAIISLTTQ